MIRRPNRVLTPLKNASNIRMSSFVTHSKSQTVGQTKILEAGTKDEMRIFEALVKDVSCKRQLGANGWTIVKHNQPKTEKCTPNIFK
jgi:hypothetical protein